MKPQAKPAPGRMNRKRIKPKGEKEGFSFVSLGTFFIVVSHYGILSNLGSPARDLNQEYPRPRMTELLNKNNL
jgi:hypothetical protein